MSSSNLSLRESGNPADPAFQSSNQPQRYLGLFLLLLDLTSANNAFQNLHNHKRGSDLKIKTQLILYKQREVYSFGFETSSARYTQRNCLARCVACKPCDQMHQQTKYIGRGFSIENYELANIQAWKILPRMFRRNIQIQYFSTSVEVLQADLMIPSQRNLLKQHPKIQSPEMVEGVVQDLTGTLKQNE